VNQRTRGRTRRTKPPCRSGTAPARGSALPSFPFTYARHLSKLRRWKQPSFLCVKWFSQLERAPVQGMKLFTGKVRTFQAPDDVCEALLVSDGRIVCVGTEAECVDAASGAIFERITAPPEGVIMPAFHDSHVHAAAGGLQIIQCNLRGCRDLASALETIRSYSRSIAEGRDAHVEQSSSWVVGGGWQPSWYVRGLMFGLLAFYHRNRSPARVPAGFRRSAPRPLFWTKCAQSCHATSATSTATKHGSTPVQCRHAPPRAPIHTRALHPSTTC
jgi:hypothetical protein